MRAGGWGENERESFALAELDQALLASSLSLSAASKPGKCAWSSYLKTLKTAESGLDKKIKIKVPSNRE